MALSHKILLLLTTFYIITNHKILTQSQQVPCLFFFGDSLFDNGNNNLLLTKAKVNYLPYGIDYPDGPTGRFSNGRNTADFLAQLLGFNKSIPPFATAEGSEIVQGVNYASGGAGILDDTGAQLGDRISLNRQLLNHHITISEIATSARDSTQVNGYLNKCLYSVNIGSNDYINNYLQPQFYATSRRFTPEQFATVLIQRYTRQLETLYSYGARKVAIFGVGLIGCSLQELARFPANGSSCVDFINKYVQLFNTKLVSLVDDLNNKLTGAQFILINSTSTSSGDPSLLGITVANAPCCAVSSDGQCIKNTVPCANRNQYLFWDGFHSTQVSSQATATRAYDAELPSDAYPFDIRRLVQQ